MVIRTGIVGVSEGNGHPFSFSAIVNGYDDAAFGRANWPVIHEYLRRQPAGRFGIGQARITHAWTQDPDLTARLCEACRIERRCADVSEMLGEVDALIIARDDWESHAALAMPFLRRGVPVFIDKPLTLDAAELAGFAPYLESGKLMSCSGLRYAAEIDAMRAEAPPTGTVRLVAGTVLNGLDKYGIHLIEAVASLGGAFARPVAITRVQAPHESFLIQLEGGIPFHLDCLGQVAKTFHLSLFGEQGHVHFDLHDNFSAFRRTLEQFYAMVTSGKPSIAAPETMGIMRLLSTSRTLQPGGTARLDA